jgi:Holliday junction DNA helicase RuvA
MFDYITGTLVRASQDSLSIEVGGIAFRIMIPLSTYANIPDLSSTLKLYLAFVIREQSQTLYGFLQAEERYLFERLINITGIGPKLALALIGHLYCHQLCEAIANKDLFTLCTVPGIGKKTAERLLVELNDTVALFRGISPPKSSSQLMTQDATSALVNLGYNQTTAQKTIRKTLEEHPEIDNLATLITISLKNI